MCLRVCNILSVDGLLGFHLLAVINNAMNIGLQVYVFNLCLPMCICLVVELLDHAVVLFNLLSNCQSVFTAIVPLCIPTSVA